MWLIAGDEASNALEEQLAQSSVDTDSPPEVEDNNPSPYSNFLACLNPEMYATEESEIDSNNEINFDEDDECEGNRDFKRAFPSSTPSSTMIH